MTSMTREQQLISAFVELADTLIDDFDVIDFLYGLTQRTVQLLGVTAAGVMLADQRGHLRPAAASTEEARLLELFEIQTDTGPCMDSYRSKSPVVNVDLRAAESRWPHFAAAAGAAGFSSAHALPLRLRDDTIGALNLFSAENTRLTEQDQRVGQALADTATIGILQHRGLRHAEILTDQLQAALNSRVVIEQAKGILAERGAIGVDEAFDTMRRHARRTHQRLSDLARAVTAGTADTTDLLTDSPGSRPTSSTESP
ncbi:GAF and ANTAR domain-containing protein [Tenggerimyces flavus]|nr:GAF and ANTAR domain-containing protein [Tenggerimyces flavus]